MVIWKVNCKKYFCVLLPQAPSQTVTEEPTAEIKTESVPPVSFLVSYIYLMKYPYMSTYGGL